MRIFISWSGSRSRVVASALREWLPQVIQRLEPWVSSEDIKAGANWQSEVSGVLANTRVGVLCLTPENLDSRWLNFEAGALAKSVDNSSYVCPYLIDLDPADIPPPIGQFQAKRADQDGTRFLVRTINIALKEAALPEGQLDDAFRTYWPRLHNVLENLPPEENAITHRREPLDILEEILQVVRGLARDHQPSEIALKGNLLYRALDQIVDGIRSARDLRIALNELQEFRSQPSEVGLTGRFLDRALDQIVDGISSAQDLRAVLDELQEFRLEISQKVERKGGAGNPVASLEDPENR